MIGIERNTGSPLIWRVGASATPRLANDYDQRILRSRP